MFLFFYLDNQIFYNPRFDSKVNKSNAKVVNLSVVPMEILLEKELLSLYCPR